MSPVSTQSPTMRCFVASVSFQKPVIWPMVSRLSQVSSHWMITSRVWAGAMTSWTRCRAAAP